MFAFNQIGDAERALFRPCDVASTNDWRSVMQPVIARYRDHLDNSTDHFQGRGIGADASRNTRLIPTAKGRRRHPPA